MHVLQTCSGVEGGGGSVSNWLQFEQFSDVAHAILCYSGQTSGFMKLLDKKPRFRGLKTQTQRADVGRRRLATQ